MSSYGGYSWGSAPWGSGGTYGQQPVTYAASTKIEMAFGSGPGSASPTWTDITTYVRSCTWQRGRQNELNQTQGGTGQMLLADPTSNFDPRKTASPFYPNVRPGTPVRATLTVTTYFGPDPVSTATYNLFKLFTERQPRTTRVTTVYTERQFDLVDGFAILANAGLAGFSYPVQTSDARVNAVLNSIGWAAGQRQIGTGVSILQAAVFPADDQTTAQAHLLAVADSENGLLFCNGQGNLVFIGRRQLIQSSPGSASQATFRDAQGTSGYPCVELVPSYDLDQVFNKWIGTREGEGALPQTAYDSTSATNYFLRVKQISSLVVYDAEVLNQVQWKLSRFSQPLDRVESITLMPLSTGEPAMASAILSREVGDRITILETPPGFSSQQSNDYVIQHLEGTIAPGTMNQTRIRFLLWPAVTVQWWLAGDATLSKAGQTTIAGY
jgi:hypothetical protein